MLIHRPDIGAPYHNAIYDVGDILVSVHHNSSKPYDRMVIMITDILPDTSAEPIQDTYVIKYLEHPAIDLFETMPEDNEIPATMLEYHFKKHVG
jgi:hypothetical protein